MKQILSLLVVAFLSVNTFAQTATTWNADPAHTQVFFNITHLGIADIKGNFGEFESSIVASKDDFSDAQYAITIQVPSINTGIEMRDNREEVFDVNAGAPWPDRRDRQWSRS